MIREFTEMTMGLRPGERHFSREMRSAFFNIGLKPPQFSERITEVRLREDGLDHFNVVVELVRTRSSYDGDDSNGVRSLVPTASFDSRDQAESLAELMSYPANLARANRALELSGKVRYWGMVIGAGGLAVAGSVTLL